MNVTHYGKYANTKSVRIDGLKGETERDILMVAFAVANETKSSVFGLDLAWYEHGFLIPRTFDNSNADSVLVTFHTS